MASRLTRSIGLRRAILTVSALTAAFAAAPVLHAERLSDKDVKALIERIDDERDRFEDQLDGKLKRTILRGASGEVNVERYLDDLQENVGKLKERFKPDYAGSAEVTTLLRQGSDIHRFMAKQPPDLDGASEWNRLSTSLQQLAAAYGVSMPIGEGQQGRRMNDLEVQKTADAIVKGADRFKKELDSSLKSDKTVDKATREAAVMEAESLKRDAKELSSVLGDGRPASGEAKALLDRAVKIRTAIAGRTLAGPARAAWSSIEMVLNDIGQGFGLAAR